MAVFLNFNFNFHTNLDSHSNSNSNSNFNMNSRIMKLFQLLNFKIPFDGALFCYLIINL